MAASSPLSAKAVLIWPDRDKPGWEYATQAAQAVLAAGAQSCHVLYPPEEAPEGWDVADAIADGFDVATFLAHGPRLQMHDVIDDVDPVVAANLSAVRKARNSGQVCTSPTRFYVHKSRYEAFTKAFAERARAVTVGNGFDPDVQMGPVANHRRIDALRALVDDARAKGARVLAGGETATNRGYFFPVTVLADLPPDARAMSEEPFGPLALINPVSSIDEAIEKANALPFGLAAYAFTHSAANVERLATGIEAGNVSINTLEASVAETPFGGTKDSGYGREGGAEGLSHYTHVKTVSHRLAI